MSRSVRVWTIGSLEHSILPTKSSVDKLRNEIALLKKGAVTDIIIGPDIKVQVVEGEFDILVEKLADGRQRVSLVLAATNDENPS